MLYVHFHQPYLEHQIFKRTLLSETDHLKHEKAQCFVGNKEKTSCRICLSVPLGHSRLGQDHYDHFHSSL